MKVAKATQAAGGTRHSASADEVMRDVMQENDQLRAALSNLLAECCDRQGALLRPSKKAVRMAILALHPHGLAANRYPGLAA